MNIIKEIQDRAKELGLEMTSLAGGCDYVAYSPECSHPVQFLIGSLEDSGSTYSLADPAGLALYVDEEYLRFVQWQFESTEKAMLALTSSNFRSAACWVLLENGIYPLDSEMESDEELFLKESCVFNFTAEKSGRQGSGPTHSEVAASILKEFGATYRCRETNYDFD